MGPERAGSDPLGEAVRAAEALAQTGIRVATGIASGALRRISGR